MIGLPSRAIATKSMVFCGAVSGATIPTQLDCWCAAMACTPPYKLEVVGVLLCCSDLSTDNMFAMLVLCSSDGDAILLLFVLLLCETSNCVSRISLM